MFILLENQTTEMRWHARNKEYYTKLGYKFTKMGDTFIVKVDDLPPNSKAMVLVQCDYCGKIVSVKMQNYTNRGCPKEKYSCRDCQAVKNKENIQIKYGVDSVFQLESVKEQSKNTCFRKYGCEYVAQSEIIKEKSKRTNIKKYGVTSYSKTKEYREKFQNTSMRRYGVPYPTMAKEIKEKIRETQEVKYNGMGMASPITKEKILNSLEQHKLEDSSFIDNVISKRQNTLYKNGTGPISEPQKILNEMLVDLYGNALLNYPCGRCLLDCVVEVNGEKFDIEYDGWYWHKDRLKQDYQRDWFIKNNGYRIIRILAMKEVPTKEQISSTISEMIEKNLFFKRIILDIK